MLEKGTSRAARQLIAINANTSERSPLIARHERTSKPLYASAALLLTIQCSSLNY